MIERNCPICPGSTLKPALQSVYTGCGVTNFSFSLLHCETCDLYAIDPMPSNEVYELSRDTNNQYIPHSAVETNQWNLPLINNVKKYAKSGELLDIGCNVGDFLPVAEQNGFRSMGVEIDEVASATGKKLGRNVIHGDFLKMKFDKKFDVVVMNHVLEHIPDVTKVPAALSELLKLEGVVVINIPYYHSWLGQILKQKWSQMAPFTHVWFYSKESIKKLFSKNFQSIEMFTNSSCEPHSIQTLSWKPLLKGLTIRLFHFLGRGDELRVILRKPI